LYPAKILDLSVKPFFPCIKTSETINFHEKYFNLLGNLKNLYIDFNFDIIYKILNIISHNKYNISKILLLSGKQYVFD